MKTLIYALTILLLAGSVSAQEFKSAKRMTAGSIMASATIMSAMMINIPSAPDSADADISNKWDACPEGTELVEFLTFKNRNTLQVLYGCALTKAGETESEISSKVSGMNGPDHCSGEPVEVKLMSSEAMSALKISVYGPRNAFWSVPPKGVSGPAKGLYLGGKMYAASLDRAIDELTRQCGWNNDMQAQQVAKLYPGLKK